VARARETRLDARSPWVGAAAPEWIPSVCDIVTHARVVPLAR
jgi:hypothetical protein